MDDFNVLKPVDKIEILDNPFLIKLSKPYKFEGKEYKELDLSNVQDATTNDMLNVQRMFERNMFISTIPETTTAYACYLVSTVCNYPIEFFAKLPIKDMMKIRTMVTSFLFNED